MQNSCISRTQSKSTNLHSVKTYYTASNIHKTPSRYTPNKAFSYQSLPHIPISFSEGRMLLFSEVFANSASLPMPRPHTRAKAIIKSKPADFFYELLQVNIPALDSSLQDLLCMIEIGIPQGDKYKEATVSLAIGDKYEIISKLLSALKFYKRALKAYEAIGDKIGKAAALNRIGIIYHNRGSFVQAKEVHKKHRKIFPNDFIPHYNLGIVNRALKMFVSSSKALLQALDLAMANGNKEEICITNAQLGLTYKAANKLDKATEAFNKALAFAKEIKAGEIIAELNIALAYLNFHNGKQRESEYYFLSSMQCALGEKSDICRVNIGILRGEAELKDRFQLYK